MPFDDLLILIPSHSLEDFPADLGEAEAVSLLNSFAVAWHPALLASVRILPRWHRADDPPDSTQKRLIFLPACCEDRLPHGWAERIASEGCAVIRGTADRQPMIAEALRAVESPGCDPELAADFLSLGFCHLQIELLTRKMRHFSNLDEVHLQREVVAAAEAALAGDAETVRTRLKSCFNVLVESRERFYPVDCYLIDLCLVIPRLADEHFRKLLLGSDPLSVLASADDLAEIGRDQPEVHAALKAAWERGTADIVCGDLCEVPLPLMPINSVIRQLGAAQDSVERSFGKRPIVWGRRRFGLFPQLPQILKKFGFEGALHVVLDDGIYPDSEYSKLRWEGTDGTSIDALTRIPLAADGSTSYLRYADRMSDSMDNDHVAGVIFARWPEVKAPFFEDLRRMARYAPVLGKFVTLTEFFTATEHPSRHYRYRPNEYLTPYLFQSVAREEADAISRYAARFDRRRQFESGAWLAAMSDLLGGRAPDPAATGDVERSVEACDDKSPAEQVTEVEDGLRRFVDASAARLAQILLAGAGERRGWLVFNTLGFRRLVSVELDRQGPMPPSDGQTVRVQWDDARAAMTVDVPGYGFVWVPASEGGPPAAASFPTLAEPNLLRNEFFEIHINEGTGGIGKIKGYGRAPNRLSQQINYRFSRERTIPDDQGAEFGEVRTHYAEMRGKTSTVTCTGPTLGEIVTTGEIVDQAHGERLAGFRQTMRVWRGRPIVEIEIELTIDRMPDAEPWHNYFAARFAWHDETASITRSVMLGAHETNDERFESPHYIELATPEQRTTIVLPGLPFHRKTGPRMIDTLLVTARETRRRFRFVIAVDQAYPVQSALDAQTPAVVVPVRQGPPKAGAAGWFFHQGARNVQILGILPLLSEPAGATTPDQPLATPAAQGGCGCGIRLIETEGRPVGVRLRCLRTPRSARLRDFRGHTLNALSIEGDAVLVDLSPHEIAEVEVRFD